MNTLFPSPPMATLHRTDITPKRTMESIVRAKTFTIEDPCSEYKEAYKELCGPEDPWAIFMARSIDLVKLLSDPLSSRPRKLKQELAKKTIEEITEMRGAMVSSLHGESLTVHYAKECKRHLFIVKANLDLMCGVNYISNNFYSKLEDIIIELYTALTRWFDVILYKPKPKPITPQPSQT